MKNLKSIKRFFLSKNSINRTVLTIVILYAPFAYLHVEIGAEGFGGYQYLNSFLWAIGYPVSALFTGLLILNLRKISDKDKGFLKLLGGGIVLVAAYYIVIAFFPYTKEYSFFAYRLIIIALAICFGLIITFLSQKAYFIEFTLRNNNLNEAIKLIFRIKNDHYQKIGVKALYAEMYDKALKSESSVAEDSDEFEEDVISTLEKIAEKRDER